MIYGFFVGISSSSDIPHREHLPPPLRLNEAIERGTVSLTTEPKAQPVNVENGEGRNSTEQ